MIHKPWTTRLVSFFANPWVRGIFLVLYYLAIIAGLILMYGRGDFSTPSFIYQGF
jgi:membrane-bound ClpP family serine protease